MRKDLLSDQFGRFWEIPYSLASMGHEINGACLSYKPRRETEVEYPTRGTPIRWYSMNAGVLKIFGLLQYFFFLKRIVHKFQPDVIWSCSDTFYGVLGHYLAKKSGATSVIDLYDNFESYGSYKIPILRSMYRKAVRESKGLSCVSNSLKTLIEAKYHRTKDTALISNGISENIFQPIDKIQCRKALGLPLEAILIGTAGALDKQRGAHIIFYALDALRKELGNIQIVVSGHRSKNTNIPSSPYIHDLGDIPHKTVPQLINSLDIAVIYNQDNIFGRYCFPQKLYEINACAVPIVAANIGEMRLILKNKPQLLYANKNVASFVKAIKYQLQNKEPLEIANLTWNHQATLLESFMNELITD